MRIWIVNPFDPLPGDPEHEGRYASLARELLRRGHHVKWWTSAFSHRFKRPVDRQLIERASAAIGLETEFLPTTAYHRNLGVRRLWNHAQLARAFQKQALGDAARPDVVVASSPPPVLARAAVEFARQQSTRAILDVQDLWPEALAQFLPVALRPLICGFLPAMWYNYRRSAAGCDAIAGVADAYVNSARQAAGEGQAKPHAVFPLGVDLAEFDAARERGRQPAFEKPAGEIWLAYAGSLSRSYDVMTILRAAAQLSGRSGLRFFIAGRGDRAAQAQRFIRAKGLQNVTMTGFLDLPAMAYLLAQCDGAFTASAPETMIFLPNKLFYYLAAGVAVLNTIPGQCSRILRAAGCGLDYPARNVPACVAAIEQLISDRDRLARMRQTARRLAETEYDRALIMPRYADFVERIGGRGT